MKKIKIILSAILSWVFALLTFAQRPTHVPKEGEPLRVFESMESVIFYIVLPVVIIVLYVVWKRRKKK